MNLYAFVCLSGVAWTENHQVETCPQSAVAQNTKEKVKKKQSKQNIIFEHNLKSDANSEFLLFT